MKGKGSSSVPIYIYRERERERERERAFGSNMGDIRLSNLGVGIWFGSV